MKLSCLKITLRKTWVELSSRLKKCHNSRVRWCKKFTRSINWSTSPHTHQLIVKGCSNLLINTTATYPSSKILTSSHVRTSPSTSHGQYVSRKSNNTLIELSMWKLMKSTEGLKCTKVPKSTDVIYILSYTDANERFIYFCQFNSEIYVHSDFYPKK